jgi:hypothetical protein
MLNNELATGFNKFGNHEFPLLVGITFHGEMINYHEFPLGITFQGKIINYHEFPFLLGITFHEFPLGITFHGEMINYHEFPLGITFHGKIINYHEFPFLLGITFLLRYKHPQRSSPP